MSIIYLILTILLILYAENYIFGGLRQVLENSFDWADKLWLPLTYWGISILLPILTVAGVYFYFKTHQPNFFGKWALSLFLAVIVSKVVFLLFLLVGDTVRLIEAGWTSIASGTSSLKGDIPGRRMFLLQSAAVVALVPFVSFIYGATKGKYRYQVFKYVLKFKDLPKSFDGYKIVQISDIHSGSFDDKNGVEKGIDLINEREADLVLFTGDLVNTYASEFEPWKDIFKQIKAKDAKYSILGNHDYGDYARWSTQEAKEENFKDLIQCHHDIDFTLLRNQSVKIERGGESIRLIGVENWGTRFVKYGDLDLALTDVDSNEFKILMSHDPTHFDQKVIPHSKHIHITLSGHTHGMQMGVEFPWLKWSPVKYVYPKWAGLYNEQGKYLNVNRGYGFLGFSGRVGIWPEITEIELKLDDSEG